MRLSAVLGKQVCVGSDLAEERLYVDPRGASAADELRSVASCLHCSVLQDGRTITMGRLGSDLATLRRERARVRLQWILRRRNEIQGFRRQRLRSETDAPSILALAGSEARELVQFSLKKATNHGNFSLTPEQLLPNEVLIEAAMDEVGLSKIASVPSGEGALWESSPSNPIAIPLPDVTNLLKRFNAAEGELGKIPISPEAISSLRTMAMRPLWSPDPSPVTSLRLHVFAASSVVNVTLEGADDTGKVVMSAYFLAGPTDQTLTASDLSRGPSNEQPHEIKLTESEVKVFDLHPDSRIPLSERQLHPDSYEPLRYLAAKAMSGVADEHPAGCFVAEVPDSYARYGLQAVRGDVLDVRLFKELLMQSDPYEEIDDGSTVVIRPVDPEEVEARRADRHVLASFIQDANQGQFVDTYAQATVSRAAGHLPSALSQTWLNLWRDRLLRRWQGNGSASLDLLYVLGGINQGYWQSMESGATYTASELGIDADLLRIVLDDRLPIRTDGSVPEIYRHASDLAPGGDVGSATFSIRPVEGQVVRLWQGTENEQQGFEPLDLNRLAGLGLVRIETSPSTGPRVTTSREEYESSILKWKFRFAHLGGGTLTIGLSPHAFFEMPLASQVTDLSDPEGFRDLPAAVQDQIWSIAQSQAIRAALAHERRQRGIDTGG